MMNLMNPKPSPRAEDAKRVVELIVDGTLDPYQINDYKHVKAVARTLDWSAHRMFKAIEAAEVAEVVKNETESTSKAQTS